MKKVNAINQNAILKQDSLVEHIDTICRLVCNSKLSQDIINQAAPDLKIISNFFGLTQMEALLFCVILYINFTSESVDLHDFARFVECSPISAFTMQRHLDSLVSKQVLKVYQSNTRRRNRQKSKLCMFEYYVPDDLITKSIWGSEKFIHNPLVKQIQFSICSLLVMNSLKAYWMKQPQSLKPTMKFNPCFLTIPICSLFKN